jgi:hypothetical protein
MNAERLGWLKAIFYYCAINGHALMRLEPGCFDALHAACPGGQVNNEGLGLFVAMSAAELEPLFDQLSEIGEQHKVDDSKRLFVGGLWDGMAFTERIEQPDEKPELILPWLISQESSEGLWLRYQPLPLPDRSNHDSKTARDEAYFPQLDASAGFGLMDDLRPYRVEHWFPGGMELEVACSTYFYSVKGIEDWDEPRHKTYLIRNAVEVERGLGIKVIEDASCQAMWSITASKWLDD